MLRSTILPLILTAGLTAQQTTTAHAQDSLRGISGNSVPFGCLTTGLFAEGRSQIQIPVTLMPGPGAKLVGIAVQSTSNGGNGTLTYPLLRITVARNSASLSPTFANNLPSPQVVLNATNKTIAWVANAWTPILFTTPYVHDNQSALVIDIQKIVTPSTDLTSRTVQNANRTDLPRMINALGGPGSGAWNAATATVTTNFALTMRLLWESSGARPLPTLKLRSESTTQSGRQFPIGGTIEHTIEASPGSQVADFIGASTNPRATPGLFLSGRFWLVDFFGFGSGVVSATGTRSMTIPIPNQSSLIGSYLAFQSLVFDTPAAPWPLTNAVDCIINN
jgi:hypothetical protein